ncbi:crossover junction endonuclease EME1 [Schistocerca serialis cubense]|uniref:crossover junction endonuclease EME1 n=1 Tax=Schistocerca serialis cubense TaxID=2023355 RepID=UPI00214E6E54|nr:crossover junction endonuclease EME1 [Schistocerca serialis cubense]XP_049941356.1 crossover junction endonuclease EME1 [Schistocerca serialis cubense]XP_049941363.1 crossover junction endonuclease EME1 [Schistocerca serialis cubense]XP_049941372.1 crossover junction endonuclease EME1 [Schistocerca serialis cubense]XP_049941382.1 crossover junction endonuclease EME1 [Schistocerca serialis cubense]
MNMDQVILISSDSSAPASPENYQDNYYKNDFKSSDVSPEKSLVVHKTVESLVKMSQDSGLSLGVSPQQKDRDVLSEACLRGYDSDIVDLGYGEIPYEDVGSNIHPSADIVALKDTADNLGTNSGNSGSDYNMKENPPDLFSEALNQLRTLLPSSHDKEDDQKKKKKGRSNKEAILEEKMQKKAEKEKKKAEAALDKAMKQAAAASSRLKKPGECLKTIKVVVDNALIQEKFGGALLSALEEIEVERCMQSQPIPSTVTWLRQIIEHSIDEDSQKLEVITKYKEEDYALLIWMWDMVKSQMQSGIFIASVLSVASSLPGKKMTLLIYDSEKYSRNKKPQKKGIYYTESSPSEDELLEALVELQLRHGCQYHLVHTPEELGAAIGQLTKAIAVKPFKLEKQEEQMEETDWFAAGDSNDCVKVDKHGNGMLQLWRQQLCQFPLASLATAEAISAVYPSPRALLEAYKCCKSEKEGLLLLQDIKVRRAAGPLATVQRIGPELSKKIFKFFNSSDGDELL